MGNCIQMRAITSTSLIALAVLTGAPAVRAADVTFERLVNPEPQNWLMNHHDYSAQRFSPLDLINKANVKGLRLAFAVALGGTSGNENLTATPLVDDGFMYMPDAWGVVYKIDVRSGTRRRHRLEDGPRPGEDRSQPRRRAVGQSRHLGDELRRSRDRDRPRHRQDRVGARICATSPT